MGLCFHSIGNGYSREESEEDLEFMFHHIGLFKDWETFNLVVD